MNRTDASSPRARLPLLLAACALATAHCGRPADGADAAPADARADAGARDAAGDAGTTSDAASDASDAGDAGARDAAGDAANDASDPCAGRLLCDDFERYDAGAPPSAPWQSHPSNGTVAVDETHAFSGRRAVHVHTEAGTYKSALITVDGAPVFPVAGNVIYGRMMLYATAAANDGVHWTMIHADGPLAGQAGVTATYNYGGQWMGRLMANYYANTMPAAFDCWDHSMTAMPTGRWACYEWRFDGPHNEMRLWLDGAEVTDVHVAGHGEGCVGMTGNAYVWNAPTFQRMSVGWESYQQDPARDAWVDDVVFDDAPIGCPPPH